MKVFWFSLILLFAISSPAIGQSEFEQFCQQYGEISTIAGTGKVREKGQSGWKSSFEDGDATKAELSRPHFVMADEAGNIFIADKDAQAIRRIDTAGAIHTVAGTGKFGDNGDGPGITRQLASPNGIWVQPDGTVYILDLGNGKIRKLSTSGKLTTVFEDKDGIVIGRGLWVAPDESVIYYACGSKVKKWTPKTGVKTLASGFRQLANLVVDPNGAVVVTDRGGDAVYRLDENGDKTRIAGTKRKDADGGDGKLAIDTKLDGVRAIWFLENGAYLLGTHEGGDVWFVDSKGIINKLISGDDEHTHKGDGKHFRESGKKLSEVRSLCIAPNGDLLICENDYGYIRVVKKVK